MVSLVTLGTVFKRPKISQMSIKISYFLKIEKSEWANEKVIVDEVKKSMMEAAKASGLNKQEMPSNVYVETLQWLPETGLVTDAFKIKRKVGL